MKNNQNFAEALIDKAETFGDIRAGIASVADVLKGPSYTATPEGEWKTDHTEKCMEWIPDAPSLLVLAMRHPDENPRLDWFYKGNTEGNRKMTAISEELADWTSREWEINAQSLPYHVERGGVYLKDAAVFAGMGVVGKNNLFLHRQWGPRVRLRAVLIQADLPSNGPVKDFNPCEDCPIPCQDACVVNAFESGAYRRPPCLDRLNSQRANPVDEGTTDAEGKPLLFIPWCRKCEFACPVGKTA